MTKAAGSPRSRREERAQIAAAAAALLVLMVHRTAGAVVDPDLWHQLALARETLRLGAVPLHEPFAYTSTLHPSVHHEWGAGVIALLLTQLTGGAGLVALRFALIAGLGVLCWTSARLRGAPDSAIVPSTLVAAVLLGSAFSTVRAQMYSFVLLAVLFCFLALDERGRRWWIAPWLALYVLWLNVHAGFLAGAGLLFLHWLETWLRGRPHRHLLFTGLAMLPLALATPYHVHFVPYLVRAVGMSRPHVAEWGPLWTLDSAPLLATYLLSLGLLAVAVRGLGWRNARGIALVLAPALLALASRRMVHLYAVAWLCTVPAWLAAGALGRSLDRLWARRRGVQAAAYALAAIVGLATALPDRPFALRVPGAPDPRLREHIVYPVGAIDHLARANFAGNLFVGFDWGAYAIWKLHPDVKVSMDSRYEVAYPAEVEEEQWAFHAARPGWEKLLERGAYRFTDAVLLPRFLASRIHERMATLPDWKRVYRDAMFEVFVRSDATFPVADDPSARFEGRFP